MFEEDGPGRGRRGAVGQTSEQLAPPRPAGQKLPPPPDPPLSLQSKLPKMDGGQAALFMTKKFSWHRCHPIPLTGSPQTLCVSFTHIQVMFNFARGSHLLRLTVALKHCGRASGCGDPDGGGGGDLHRSRRRRRRLLHFAFARPLALRPFVQ